MMLRIPADMRSHHTRSNARAVRKAPIDFSTLANCFSMLIANAVTTSFKLSILPVKR